MCGDAFLQEQWQRHLHPSKPSGNYWLLVAQRMQVFDDVDLRQDHNDLDEVPENSDDDELGIDGVVAAPLEELGSPEAHDFRSLLRVYSLGNAAAHLANPPARAADFYSHCASHAELLSRRDLHEQRAAKYQALLAQQHVSAEDRVRWHQKAAADLVRVEQLVGDAKARQGNNPTKGFSDSNQVNANKDRWEWGHVKLAFDHLLPLIQRYGGETSQPVPRKELPLE